MRRRSVKAVIALAAGTAMGVVAACQQATSVRLELSTNVSCDRALGVQVFAGKPGSIEANAPAAEDPTCVNGSLGTIVAQPPEEKTAPAAFRVVLGVTRPVSQCTASDGYAGCIVQRRELRYIDGETLRLPIVMYEWCIGVACDPSSTCASNGLCVSAKITDSAACIPPSICLPPGDPGTPAVPGVPVEAGADSTLPRDGAVDGTTPVDSGPDATGDAASDAGGIDAGSDSGKDSSSNSGKDSGSDAGSDGGGTDGGGTDGGGGASGTVACGALTCSAGQACCSGKIGGAAPVCIASDIACSPPQAHVGRIDCDQSSDCPPMSKCCNVSGNIVCLPQGQACVIEQTACRSAADCGGAMCSTGINIGQVIVTLCGGEL